MGHTSDHLSAAPPETFTELDGSNGFAVHGGNVFDLLGYSASGAGDIDRDGFADLLVAAPLGDPDGKQDAGEIYVIFGGTTDFAPVLGPAILDGLAGFQINGANPFDGAGVAVSSAGDFNGDGIADIVIGAQEASPGGLPAAGSSYIVLGSKSGFFPAMDLATLTGADGFRLNGVAADDRSGTTVSGAGDINGDGFSDIIINNGFAEFGDLKAGGYVVFGSGDRFPPVLSLASLDGGNGFRIDRPGAVTEDAGDINDDGIGDLIIGGDGSVTHVLFGTNGAFPASIDPAAVDGTNGFRITGVSSGFGSVVSGAGDVNGDGIADVMIGAWDADVADGPFGGRVYVVFGSKNGFPADFHVTDLDGTNGFRIEGAPFDFLGFFISGAGDVNGDGVDDIVISQNLMANTNYVHVVYGRDQGFSPVVKAASMDAGQGFRIFADAVNDGDQLPVGEAGDLNGDGFSDFVVGSPLGQPGGLPLAGKAFAVFGDDFTASVTHRGTVGDDSFVGTAGPDVMTGGPGDDLLDGRGGADTLNSGPGDDLIAVSDAGFQRIDGGGGDDKLLVIGFDLDLTAVPNLQVRNIETIDLKDGAANTVTLNIGDLRTLSDSSHEITILGDKGDRVVIDLRGLGFGRAEPGNGLVEYTVQNVEDGLTLMVQDSLDLSGILF